MADQEGAQDLPLPLRPGAHLLLVPMADQEGTRVLNARCLQDCGPRTVTKHNGEASLPPGL